MKKAQVFTSLEDMKRDQCTENMRLTTEQRWNLAFELIELAIELSPDKKTALSSEDDNLPWIVLKFRNEITQGNH